MRKCSSRGRFYNLKRHLIKVHGIRLNNPDELYILTLCGELSVEQIGAITDQLRAVGVTHFVVQVVDKSGTPPIEFVSVSKKVD